jgi:hypothetical protein
MLLFLLHVVLGFAFLAVAQSVPEGQIAFDVDDTYPSISYSGEFGADWITLIDQPESRGLFNNTDTSSHVQNATLIFAFVGMFNIICVRLHVDCALMGFYLRRGP